MAWTFDNKGLYLIKSGYKVAWNMALQLIDESQKNVMPCKLHVFKTFMEDDLENWSPTKIAGVSMESSQKYYSHKATTYIKGG